MLAAAIAAVGYLPARDRLLASATRFVYGAREAPDEVLRTFGSRLTRAVAMDELLLQLAESLRKTMALTSAEVYTGTGEVLERAVSVPDAGRRSHHRRRPGATGGHPGRRVGQRLGVGLAARAARRPGPAPSSGSRRSATRASCSGSSWCERPAEADPFTEEDDRVLTELARQVGLAFHNVQLDAALQTTLDELRRQADELRESRARIVASGDAERRRVERNLHDGAQQHLVALAVNLRLARDIVADDPETGAEMLGQLADEVQATIQELRELAHGIYPPLLVDSGLGDALRAAAGRSPLPVTVDRRRHRPVLPGHRGGDLLLLPGGAAERGQARRRGDVQVGSGRSRRAAVLGRRRRPRLRRGAGPARPRVRQHGRPARRHRRHGAVGVGARSRRHDRGSVPVI